MIRYFWKVLIDEAANTGVAFLGVNNIYYKEDVELLKICQERDHPIMDNIFYPNDVERGVTFACAVPDAAAVIPEIPDFGDIGFLS